MRANFPGGHREFVANGHRPDPARAEYLLVARRMQSGVYTLGVRLVQISPFRIRSAQLGALRETSPYARNPLEALLFAAGLLSQDQETRSMLDH